MSISSQKRKLPPQGLANIDDQGQSSTCVRFALSKAITNTLFLKEKIDIEQKSITMCLVQEKKQLCDPGNPINPTFFDNTTLYLQDERNDRLPNEKKKNEKCWWKVTFLYNF